jgi:hypothetical protein
MDPAMIIPAIILAENLDQAKRTRTLAAASDN